MVLLKHLGRAFFGLLVVIAGSLMIAMSSHLGFYIGIIAESLVWQHKLIIPDLATIPWVAKESMSFILQSVQMMSMIGQGILLVAWFGMCDQSEELAKGTGMPVLNIILRNLMFLCSPILSPFFGILLMLAVVLAVVAFVIFIFIHLSAHLLKTMSNKQYFITTFFGVVIGISFLIYSWSSRLEEYFTMKLLLSVNIGIIIGSILEASTKTRAMKRFFYQYAPRS